MAGAGLRLLAFAVHTPAKLTLPTHSTYLSIDELPTTGWQLLGLVGMVDPARDEAKAAVADCQRAGIRIVMITGDHASTAGAIGQQVDCSETSRVNWQRVDNFSFQRRIVPADRTN